MNGYLAVGLSVGIGAYIAKLVIFYIGTSAPWTRWIRRLFHSGPFGLFCLDALAGYVVIHMFSSTGAAGLTTLFVLVGFSLASVTYIIIYLSCKKCKKVYHNMGEFI